MLLYSYIDRLAIALHGLTKRFRETVVVDGLDLEIAKGEIFGLLGPNGTCKSTIIKILTTMLRPSGGRASIFGHDVVLDKDAVRSCIGVVFQDATLDGKLTARENLDFHAPIQFRSRRAPRPHR